MPITLASPDLRLGLCSGPVVVDSHAHLHKPVIGADLAQVTGNRIHHPKTLKRSTTPKVERGFYSACEDIQPSRKWLIYPGSECYPLGDGIEVMSLHGAMEALA